MHKDGKPIDVRSAGAEHIVALSLMGALQRNAPLKGPIVMDSPFGRLDEGHTKRVVRALPMMSDQVVLLVYRGELDAQKAREELGGRLVAEYELRRRSARHTQIEKAP
jgi:DNA sulfur modification protein DndD